MKIGRILNCIIPALGLVLLAGCGGYQGKYMPRGGSGDNSIEVSADSITVSATIDGNYVSNYGKIEKIEKSADGKTTTLTGYLDYSGGSGTAFGVTVSPGSERHWTKPFTATVNHEAGTISFSGTLIIDSMTYRSWYVEYQK